ncbi:MAG: GNAT family N-acetyltransferase [Pseudomonadota bacterium]
MTPPTLHTQRLILTALGERHFAPMAEFYASERSRFVGGPDTAERTWRTLASEIGHWTLCGYGRFAVEDKETGVMIGIVGPWNPEGWPEPELGWDLMNGFEGKGYATEAAAEARRWVYTEKGWETAISLTADGNGASARLAQRLGCTHDGRFTHEFHGSMDIWRHPSPSELREQA